VRISAQERVVVQVPSGAAMPLVRVAEKVHVAWSAANGIIFAGPRA
jgi:hypothetical protein